MGEWTCSSTILDFSALDGGEWSASRPVHFTPGEMAPCTLWIGGWVGTRAGLWTKENSCQEGNRTRAVHPVARRYTHGAIPTPKE
jgi:hypothetical protein